MWPNPRSIALACVLVAAANPVAAQRDVRRDSAESITAWAAGVERKRASLKAIVLDLPSRSAEGSLVALFRMGDSIRKVTGIYYGESGRATECYYVLDDRPRLLVRTEWRYTRPLPLSGKVRSRTTERIWLSADSVFRWQDARGRVAHTRVALRLKGEEVRRDFAELIRATHDAEKLDVALPDVPCD
jgi:hypothetical protein